ncbi:MAG: hypothetical protein ACR2QB_05135 [Gammaproteobacteria bacterium]
MRQITVLAGLVCGCLVTLAFLLAGGLGLLQAKITPSVDKPGVLQIDEVFSRGMAEQPAALLGLAPSLGGGFEESSLRHVRISVARLDSPESGDSALAIKISAPATENSLLNSQLYMQSTWNLGWPGHGSVFLIGQDNHLPLLGNLFWNLFTGDGFELSERPHPLSERTRLLGAGGRLSAAEGIYQEYRVPPGAGELELGLENN